jgi:hypothetical protein
MKTQIFECDIIVNGKKTSIINTEMNIDLDWDIDFVKNDDNASIFLRFKNVKGFVSFSTIQTNYKKSTTIEINADSTWQDHWYEMPKTAGYECLCIGQIQPIYCIINLDEKRVTIGY